MANPQLENGYTSIANEIMDALCRCHPGGAEGQILWAVMRKTYGWKKSKDQISISQLCELTCLARRTVIYAIHNLEAKNMIQVERAKLDGFNEVNVISFQKDHEKWVVQEMDGSARKCASYKATIQKQKDNYKRGVVQETVSGARKRKRVVQENANDIPFLAPTKETITKETITKEKTNRSNDFDRLWITYPKKVGKQAAMRAYKTHIKRMPPINILVEIISRQKQTDQWQRGYIPNPATWINQGRWDDDISSMNGGNEHGSSRVYAGQRQNVPTTRQMEIDAETERLAQEYYRLKENSAASNP
jgi:phage replication O-like protein O